MSTGAKGHAAKSLATWAHPPHTPLDPGMGTMIAAAATRAAATFGFEVETGEALGLAELVAEDVAPQPAKASSVTADRTTAT
jgi:hypothetical protein